MNAVIVMLLAFVALGLGSTHLGRRGSLGIGVVILAYLIYAYYLTG